jgi:hypothetical protein
VTLVRERFEGERWGLVDAARMSVDGLTVRGDRGDVGRYPPRRLPS